MRAIRLEKPGQFARIEIEEPSHPAAGEAIVRVHRVGICGSDISGYLGKMPFYSYPRIPGHVLGVMTDGGLRDRFIVPAHKLHPSKKLSFDQLALVETLAIGCHAVDRPALTAGENCLVIGAGPIGLSCIVFAKLI